MTSLTANRRRTLHSSPLRRPASVVRNRRNVADHAHFDSSGCKSADRRFTPRSRTADANIDGAHAMIARLIGRIHRRLLRGERSPFSGTAEAERAGALPRHHLTFIVRDGNDGVVERSLNVREPKRHIFAFFFLELLLLACFLFGRCRAACCCCRFRHDYVFAAAFFLFATVPLRGPLRVRALVCVRCPRTGRLRRWRCPRYEPISISRLMCMLMSLRRSPSTSPSASIAWRMRLTSSSFRSWTFFIGSTLAVSSSRLDREFPMP